MKRRRDLQSKMTQFSYDHIQLNREFTKLRKSADDLGKLLDNMSPKSPKSNEKEKK